MEDQADEASGAGDAASTPPALHALRAESTTPLVRRWLLGLHEAGDTETIRSVASARYLVDHRDADILFAQHLADAARDASYLDAAGALLAAAALRHDYLRAPAPALCDRALEAYYPGVGLEAAIRADEVSFDEALSVWAPAIGRQAPDRRASREPARGPRAPARLNARTSGVSRPAFRGAPRRRPSRRRRAGA